MLLQTGFCYSLVFILIILNLVTVSFDFYLAFTAPDEGEFCLTEILGIKITLLICPISLAIGFLIYSTLLILIYTKIRLHLATVCSSGPCIELPDLGYIRDEQKANEAACFDYREKMSLPVCAEFVLGWLVPR